MAPMTRPSGSRRAEAFSVVGMTSPVALRGFSRALRVTPFSTTSRRAAVNSRVSSGLMNRDSDCSITSSGRKPSSCGDGVVGLEDLALQVGDEHRVRGVGDDDVRPERARTGRSSAAAAACRERRGLSPAWSWSSLGGPLDQQGRHVVAGRGPARATPRPRRPRRPRTPRAGVRRSASRAASSRRVPKCSPSAFRTPVSPSGRAAAGHPGDPDDGLLLVPLARRPRAGTRPTSSLGRRPPCGRWIGPGCPAETNRNSPGVEVEDAVQEAKC